MELKDAISKRRSIRKFKEEAVCDDLIYELLESARLCQSAKNRQPWRFMIITGDEKNTVAELMINAFDVTKEMKGYKNSSKASAEVIKKASRLIAVFRENDKDWQTSDLLSIGAAIEHICLTSVDIGLGSLWIRDTAYCENEICKMLGFEEMQLVSVIAIGYADESPHPRLRKNLSEIII